MIEIKLILILKEAGLSFRPSLIKTHEELFYLGSNKFTGSRSLFKKKNIFELFYYNSITKILKSYIEYKLNFYNFICKLYIYIYMFS